MDTRTLGRMGEDAAAEFLRARGWRILDRNVRCGRKEVDIIATRGQILVFVEVKCRRSRICGHPMEAITPLKQREIAEVARGWLRGRTLPPETLIRFDAVSVLCFPDGSREIFHQPDAWRLG